MNNFGIYFILSIMIALGGRQAHAQYIPSDLSEKAHVSIITVGPAEPLYTMFGHTAIRLQDPRRGIDVVYNYGTFDFESDGFYWKFVRGDLRYFLSKSEFEDFKAENSRLGRSVCEQVLDLDIGTVRKIVHQLEMELLPENRYYQYEFFTNNCVTKVRDLLEDQHILDNTRLEGYGEKQVTYRQLLYPYLESKLWLRLAINVLLGASADEILNKRSQQFLPNQLFQSLSKAQYFKTDSALVVNTVTLEGPAHSAASSWFTPELFFWFLLVITGSITLYEWRKKIRTVWIDRLLFGSVGILGLVLFSAWLGSQHEPLHQNWNLVWALPTHVIAAIGIGSWNHHFLFRYHLWFVLLLNISFLLGWTFIPQQIPIAVVPFIFILCFRIMFNLMSAKHYNPQPKPNYYEKISEL